MNIRVSQGPAELGGSFGIAGIDVTPGQVQVALKALGSSLHIPPHLAKHDWILVPDCVAHAHATHRGHRVIGWSEFCTTWLSPKQRVRFARIVRMGSSDKARVKGHGEEDEEGLRVLLVTFNQGEWKHSHAQTTARVRAFLQARALLVAKPCHLVVLATQEADNLLPTAFALALEPTFAPVLAESMSQLALGSLQLHVWARSSALDSVKIDLHNDMRCGLFSGKTLAKGAVFAQLTLATPTVTRSLVVASLHLPSDARASDLRNDCLARIYTRIRETVVTAKGAPSPPVFLMGDLNYRTSTTQKVTDPNERQRIRAATCGLSPEPDQLDTALEQDDALVATGLVEIGPRTFCATCRFVETPDEGDASLEPRAYDDRRYPSWCDRILYRPGAHADSTEVERYDSWEVTPESDHNAVFALVRLG
jgi:endonuclease/exonuclease/phosphatase family metal-dependent hydrolase